MKRLIATHRRRYLIIGCVCAALNNIIMISGDWAGQSYAVMTLVSFLVLTPLAYVLHTRFTFAERLSWHRLVRFVSGAAMALPLALVTMAVLCSLLKLPVFIAAPITTIVLFLWNYAAAHLSILGRLRHG